VQDLEALTAGLPISEVIQNVVDALDSSSCLVLQVSSSGRCLCLMTAAVPHDASRRRLFAIRPLKRHGVARRFHYMKDVMEC